MNPKRIVSLCVSLVVLAVLVSVIIAAAGIGGEASKLDGLMKGDSNTHVASDVVNKQISDMGFSLSPTAAATTHLVATGPKHWALAYNTWLTLDVTIGQDGKMNGYHIDRASGWF